MSYTFLKRKTPDADKLRKEGLNVQRVIWVAGDFVIEWGSPPTSNDLRKLLELYPELEIVDDEVPEKVKRGPKYNIKEAYRGNKKINLDDLYKE